MKLPKKVQEQIDSLKEEVLSETLCASRKRDLEFERERQRLASKGIKTQTKYMFHLTDSKSARRIQSEGFQPSKAFYKAFGKGINLCPKIEDVLKYKRMRRSETKRVSILVVKVLIGKSHPNESDDQVIIREKNGANYSKPKYMMPKKGFDSMYSLRPLKQIWIIPNKKRAIPIVEIEIQD